MIMKKRLRNRKQINKVKEGSNVSGHGERFKLEVNFKESLEVWNLEAPPKSCKEQG